MHRILRQFGWVVVAALASMSAKPQAAAAEPLREFITRRGDQLFEGERPFRFISVCIPNLQLVEDNFALDAETAWGWPNEYELCDALESVRQMGGTVARTYVLSVRREGSDMGGHVYVRGPGEFNEEAFRTLDLALEIANRKGVRLIIPLVDNWKWHGGIGEYAAFRGKQPEDFWTDEQIIRDFEQTVRYVLTRVNTRTGVAYRDDPAIFGWETGNELESKPEWTRRIARLMKELDPNHLVIDGDSLHGIPEWSLDDPNVDAITTHHYPNTDADYVKAILAAREKCRGKKAYFVGEFGFVPTARIRQVYDAVIDNGVSGALLWSLRHHHRDGGFYWHFEPLGESLYKAYHWPGFDTGSKYDEREVLRLTRAKAFEIRGIEPPAVKPPAPPTLLPIEDVSAISWQGSAGASDYIVERAESDGGPWQEVAKNVDDTWVQYRPLFNDASAEVGKAYYYRVKACNEARESEPSNAVGPIAVKHRTLVDEGQDLANLAATTGDVKPSTGEDRKRREDIHRILIPAGGSITYRVDGPMKSWRAILFREQAAARIEAETSLNGETFSQVEPTAHIGPEAGGDYGYLQMIELESQPAAQEARYLRLRAVDGPVEVSRVEIRHSEKYKK
jgi:mannan endo-1,4-beta-mannosidase